MSRSSIFNFESLEGFKPRLPGALLASVLIIVALEAAMRLTPDTLVPNRIETEVRFMEEQLLPRIQEPRVVVLGSSRVRRAVVPAQLDEELGLPRNSTVNAGMAMGRLYDALYFYERNRALLGKADVVVFSFDEWHFSVGGRLGTHYELHAPWVERFQFSGLLRSRMVLDGLFSMRIKLPLLPRKLMVDAGLRQPNRFQLSLNDDNQILPPERPVAEDGLDVARLRKQIELLYDDFEISPVPQEHLRRLAEMVKADGARLVLLQMPNRNSYQAEVERTHGKEYQAHARTLRALSAELNAPLHYFERPEECGMTDADYVDYGHISLDGSRTFTTFLARLLREQNYLRE
jgi:hypothetical protein